MKAYSYIRFSTPEQLKGDSFRRQMEATRDYCKKEDLQLDESMALKDLGLSAFHGVHKTKGALGLFLKLVEDGKIKPGSVLIVENLDRLSRQQVLDALNQFTSIIKAGIKIVTLQDGMEYDQTSINENWAQLIISITYMARAHDESLRKSQRLKSVWEQKRKQAGDGQIMTSICPAWLKVDPEKKEFIVRPEVVEAIDLIFDKKLQGWGGKRILSYINQLPHVWKPPKKGLNKTGGWYESYIHKLLQSRSLIGEFRSTIRDENRTKLGDGQVIPNYFPKVIDEEKFNAVQNLINKNRETNKGHGGGRKGKARNVFTQLLVCGDCGSKMHFFQQNKKNTYLRCDAAKRKLIDEEGNRVCAANSVRYDEFLQIFFEDFEELDINELIDNPSTRQDEMKAVRQSIEAKTFEMSENKRQQDNFLDEIGKTDDKDLRAALTQRYQKLKAQEIEIKPLLKQLESKLEELNSAEKQMKEDIQKSTNVYQLLQDEKDETRATELRLKLRVILRRLIKQIKITTLKEGKKGETIEVDPGVVRWTDSKYIKRIVIRFNGGKSRLSILQLQGYSDIRE